MTTRKGATIVALAVLGVLLAFVAMQAPSDPLQTARLTLYAPIPVLPAFGCLRFLAKMEKEHQTPTPEMKFIFWLAVMLPIGIMALSMAATYPR